MWVADFLSHDQSVGCGLAWSIGDRTCHVMFEAEDKTQQGSVYLSLTILSTLRCTFIFIRPPTRDFTMSHDLATISMSRGYTGYTCIIGVQGPFKTSVILGTPVRIYVTLKTFMTWSDLSWRKSKKSTFPWRNNRSHKDWFWRTRQLYLTRLAKILEFLKIFFSECQIINWR